ncbi:MAG TPA: flagellar biosynthetic protein FliR [Isosphaeraceae bacterium]|jgi:flagellar biosynthesis protein FliR|nr:flagellar biosynthetic protein FliR [Isosphaeraceae bacterium]
MNANIYKIEIAWLLAQGGSWLLVLARVAGLAWLAPAWGTPGLGWRIRLGLAVLLTAVLVPVVGPYVTAPTSIVVLFRASLAEALVGAALGWTAALVVAGARQAGEIVGTQAGLSPASLLDPEVSDGLTPFGHLYGLIALALFLALDGPLALVGALVDSYRAVPVGGLPMTAQMATETFGQVGQALALALRAAAPVALALALAGMAIGLLGRAAPTFQFMALALPARAAIGLVLVLLGLMTLAATLMAAWASQPMLGPMLSTSTS